MSAPSDQRQIEILLKVQRLLEEGSFTSTYKFALVQALVELAVETGNDDDQELVVSSRAIAERFIASYWPQVRPYVRGALTDAQSDRVAEVAEAPPVHATERLRQGTQQDDAIPREVEALAKQFDGSLSRARCAGPRWNAVVMRVRSTVCNMPLWYLQNIGRTTDDFLYERPTRKGLVDQVILRPCVGFTLRRFQHLLREMVRGAWVGFVRDLKRNKPILGDGDDLHEHLFPKPRRSLEDCREPLLDWQGGCCLYCGGSLRRDSLEVDHFIPWTRFPSSLAHNLVASCAECNNRKSSHLAAVPHLKAWLERNSAGARSIEFAQRGVFTDSRATCRIARWAYSQAADTGARVWEHGRVLVPLDERWREILSSCA